MYTFDRREIFRNIGAYEPLNPADADTVAYDLDGKSACARNLPVHFCPEIDGAPDMVFRIRLIEYTFGPEAADPRAFITIRLGKVPETGEVESMSLSRNRTAAVVWANIYVNRDLFESLEEVKQTGHWLCLQNRTSMIAHEVLYADEYHRCLWKEMQPIPDFLFAKCESWNKEAAKRFGELTHSPTQRQDDDLVCSAQSIHKEMKRICGEIKFVGNPLASIAEWQRLQGSEVVNKFRQHWCETYCVREDLLEEKVLEAIARK